MARRRRRSRNPSALAATLVTIGATLGTMTVVGLAMLRQRNLAMRQCTLVEDLAQSALGIVGGGS